MPNQRFPSTPTDTHPVIDRSARVGLTSDAILRIAVPYQGQEDGAILKAFIVAFAWDVLRQTGQTDLIAVKPGLLPSDVLSFLAGPYQVGSGSSIPRDSIVPFARDVLRAAGIGH